AKDSAGYNRAIEKLVAYYPKRDYWQNAVYNVVIRSGFNDRLQIDVARLKFDLGLLQKGDEYVDFAQLSLIEGFPAEATKVIDKGYAAGVLGAGPDAARHKRLKDLAAKNLAEDKKNLAVAEKQEPPKDGKTLFN